MARGRTRGGRLWTCIVHKPTGCVVCAVGIISAIILPGKLFHQAVVSFQSIILAGVFFSQLPRVFNHYSSIILVGKIFRLQRTNQSFYRVIILVGRYCSYNDTERDCYNLQTARISFGTIPRRNPVATAKKSMANHIHARVCSLETVGMPAPMRKMDSPAVILVITFMMSNNTVFDYP